MTVRSHIWVLEQVGRPDFHMDDNTQARKLCSGHLGTCWHYLMQDYSTGEVVTWKIHIAGIMLVWKVVLGKSTATWTGLDMDTHSHPSAIQKSDAPSFSVHRLDYYSTPMVLSMERMQHVQLLCPRFVRIWAAIRFDRSLISGPNPSFTEIGQVWREGLCNVHLLDHRTPPWGDGTC